MTFDCNGAERMRIDSSGNVGIGTTDIGAKLSVRSAASASITNVLDVGNAQNAAGTGHGAMIRLHCTIDENRGVAIASSSAANYAADNHMLFYTSTSSTLTERMRIDASGNLLVGCTSFGSISTEGCQLSNGGTAIFSNDSDVPLYLNRVIGSTAYTALVSIYREDAQSGFIGASQGATPTFAAPSDIRLKNNVTDHELELTNLMALRPVRWDWKDETRGSGEGFVAQELEQTAWADLVSEGEDGYKIVSGLGAVETRLIKAIQELSAQVTELKAEVAALKGE